MIQLTLTTTQVVEMSVTVNNNSPIQDYVHPDDQTQPFEMTPGFKPFTIENNLCIMAKSKWEKACPLQRRFLQEIQFASYVVVLMRVTMCFEYSARLAYLTICIQEYM